MKTMSPNDFGKKYLVEQCQKVRISDFIRKTNQELKGYLLKTVINAEGYNLSLKKSKTGFGGTRYWFSCPICNKRSGVIYRHSVSQILGCRRCLKLDYRKHRYKGMIEEDTS